jgi:hypothetical protein
VEVRINFAHLRERSTTGNPIDFAVFAARATSGTQQGKANVLAELTLKARNAGYKVDQSALAFEENGRNCFYGDKPLVEYLSRCGVPRWTHWIDA